MVIKEAKFVVSNSDVNKCPNGTLPEYAFIGRSNVGKSSLINMLSGNKSLAMVSATPGKTLLINHFLVNGEWYIVDLPGYGYARRDKKSRETLGRMIQNYILYRQQMTNLFVLIDVRLEPQQIDLDFLEWLGQNGIPFSIVFTKLDKLNASEIKRNTDRYRQILLEKWEELPPIFHTSSVNRTGRDEILDYIEDINASL